MLTTARNRERHQPVLRFGAMSVLFKEKPFQALVDSMKQAHRAEIWLDRSLMTDVLRELSSAKVPKQIDDEARKVATLTKREREVAGLIADGAKIKEVADHLLMSGSSVHQHLRSILGKLGLSDRFELALYACLHDLSRPAVCAPPLRFLDRHLRRCPPLGDRLPSSTPDPSAPVG
jgi:DNA-binding NarL/FixJ family response regulator